MLLVLGSQTAHALCVSGCCESLGEACCGLRVAPVVTWAQFRPRSGDLMSGLE